MGPGAFGCLGLLGLPFLLLWWTLVGVVKVLGWVLERLTPEQAHGPSSPLPGRDHATRKGT